MEIDFASKLFGNIFWKEHCFLYKGNLLVELIGIILKCQKLRKCTYISDYLFLLPFSNMNEYVKLVKNYLNELWISQNLHFQNSWFSTDNLICSLAGW